jgi:hypothetical protein
MLLRAHLPKLGFAHTQLFLWLRFSPSVTANQQDLTPLTEICYKIQYVERNGRNRGDPWSLRQVGIYQKSSFESGRSIWIFAQLPNILRARLQQTLREAAEQDQSPMKFHAILFSVIGRNWTAYIEDLYSQVAELVSLAQSFRLSTEKT